MFDPSKDAEDESTAQSVKILARVITTVKTWRADSAERHYVVFCEVSGLREYTTTIFRYYDVIPCPAARVFERFCAFFDDNNVQLAYVTIYA